MQQTRRGKGNALAVGFGAATGDIIVMFDADGPVTGFKSASNEISSRVRHDPGSRDISNPSSELSCSLPG